MTERPSVDDVWWAAESRTQDRSSLPRLRTTAEAWRKGLTGLTGLLTGAAAVGTPFISSELADTKGQNAVGLLVIAGTLVLAASSWSAMRASFGTPTEIDTGGPALRAWTVQEINTTYQCLVWARRLAVASFVTLICAATVGYFAPKAPAGELVTVVNGSGKTLCGVVNYDKSGTTMTLVGPDGTVRKLPIASIKSITDGGCS